MIDAKERIVELEKTRERLKLGGGKEIIERLHKEGKLTARERLAYFVDPGSFREYNLWAKPTRTGFPIDDKEIPGDAVVTGFATVNGRPICVYAHDFSSVGGSQASIQNWKVTKTMENAVRLGIPYVGIVDSGGVRIQDGMGVVTGKSMSIRADVWLSPSISNGVVPGVTILLGSSFAGTAYSPMLADVFFMVDTPYCLMSLASPELLKSVTFAEVTRAQIGASRMHAEVSGSCDYLGKTEQETLEKARDLLGYLPSNFREKPPVIETGDDPCRRDESLIDVVPSNLKDTYDIRDVIMRLVDKQQFLELKGEYAKNVVTGLGRLGGRSVGIIANNPLFLDGAIDLKAAEKEARFVRYCDAFNIPLVFIVDTPGIQFDEKQAFEGLERHLAMVTYAICEATVPKITLHVRRCHGEGYCAMGTRLMGVDAVLAWPTAQVQRVGLKKAVKDIYNKKIEEIEEDELHLFKQRYFDSPGHAGALCEIDDVIDPAVTRSYLIDILKVTTNKNEERPWKRIGNIPC